MTVATLVTLHNSFTSHSLALATSWQLATTGQPQPSYHMSRCFTMCVTLNRMSLHYPGGHRTVGQLKVLGHHRPHYR